MRGRRVPCAPDGRRLNPAAHRMATEKGAGVTIDVVQTGISAETDTILSDTIQQSNKSIEQRALEGMQRYYYLAKKQAWDVRALSWGKIAPVPEGTGAEVKRARRHAMWRSVVTQQLQADMIAVQCSVHLLPDPPHPHPPPYYTPIPQNQALPLAPAPPPP